MKILGCTNPKDACQLTYEQIKEAAIKSINIKGFECFFINLGQNIGYSMLVFKNKRYIYHANEYQRYGHYDITDDDQLFTLYVKELNDGLFTDEEMKEMSYTRDEYVQKKYFLENYFILQFHYLPTWYESTRFKEMYQMLKIQFPYRCDVCRCYVDSQEIVDQANKYKENLEKSLKNMENNHKLLRRIISEKIQKKDMIKFMSPIMLLSSIGIDYHDLTEDEKKIAHEELRKIGVDWKDWSVSRPLNNRTY